MSSITLIHPEETRELPAYQVTTKCSLFQNNVTLITAPYRVQSSVSLSIFQDFISALEGNAVKITDTNFTEFQRLCEEFGFKGFAARLSEFRPSMDFKEAKQADLGERIAILEEKSHRNERDNAILQDKFKEFTQHLNQLNDNVSALWREVRKDRYSWESSYRTRRTADEVPRRVPEEFSREINELRRETSILWKFSMSCQLDSRIISRFPEIFGQFQGRQFSVLWRGSSDGFSSSECHRRCDGHANTLTVILDTKGNIFGGFTPVEWESRRTIGSGDNCYKADESRESFLFTLKNPHKVSERIFMLKAEKKQQAIHCDSTRGPCFGNDIAVYDNCNANGTSLTAVGTAYINDTKLDGNKFFTGSYRFQAKEIELFEITH
jgi:hypothetical protein